MTYAERVLDYLWSIAPDGATNGELAGHLNIRSKQTVYMLTQRLMSTGRIVGERAGATWVFRTAEQPASALLVGRDWPGNPPAAARFEELARRVLTEHYGVLFPRGSVSGVRKQFDFVSPDYQVVGHALYFPRVEGLGLPPAKFSIVGEHLWLLDKTGAPTRFLVFGEDRELPLRWFERYGNLAPTVTFFFLSDRGALNTLAGPD